MRGEDDLPGKLGELIRYGIIDTVDVASGKVTVRVGEVVTANIRWLSPAGGTRVQLRPKVGEQVMLFAPEGDIEGAIALRGVHSSAFPPIGDEDREVILFEDGARISYDPAAHALEAILPAGATTRLEADGGISIKGDVAIEGKLTVTEDVLADGDVKAGEISLRNHKHGGVQAGAVKTGAPE